MKSRVNRISHAHICQVTGFNHLEWYFLIFSLNNIHSKSLRTKPDFIFPSSIFKVCKWICTEFCRTSSFPLNFAHWTAIPVDFHLGSLQHPHTTTTLPQAKWTHPKVLHSFVPRATSKKRIPQYLGAPHGTEAAGAGIGMPRGDGEAGHWRGSSSCSAHRLEWRVWAARGGTGHQCHWLSKSKNRTILRQVPKQGAINFLGTISSYASRLLLYPLYGQ